MLPLEIALLTIQAFFTIVTLGGAVVGVVVLLRTSTIKGLALEVDALTDQVTRFRNRDTRRASVSRKTKEVAPQEEEPLNEADQIAARKAQIEREYLS